jgi:hypothetical protein
MSAASLAGNMTRGAKVALAVSLVLVIVPASAFMFLVTTFLFHFSGGQSRMEAVVNYGALAVIAATALVAVVGWRTRSPVDAIKYTAIATGVLWVAALFVEWGFSFALGAG